MYCERKDAVKDDEQEEDSHHLAQDTRVANGMHRFDTDQIISIVVNENKFVGSADANPSKGIPCGSITPEGFQSARRGNP